MQVSDWIYLRDTSRYYVFIKADQRSACAVRGLTETVKKASPSGGPFLFDRNVSPVRFEGATHKRVSFAKHPQDAQNAVASDSGPGGVRAKPESSCRARHFKKQIYRLEQIPMMLGHAFLNFTSGVSCLTSRTHGTQR